jgi:fructose-bisphosphate aldolase/6-deoxy-5-ketofructose 1-phosphate synthase
MENWIPISVPGQARREFILNYNKLTQNSGNLVLFAGDQRVEHLNDDFVGTGIDPDDANPEHFFKIASKSRVGAMACQMGLIARYGQDYKEVPYLVKLNSKSNLVKTETADPLSTAWYTVDQVEEFKRSSGLNVLGVGYTVYLGSRHEAVMLKEAAQMIYFAHRMGFVTVLWMYPRGQAVKNERDSHLLAGAAGIGACLGADFVKLNYPKSEDQPSRELLKEAVQAAGRTKIVCECDSGDDSRRYLQDVHDQIHVSGAHGTTTVSSIHQKSVQEAAAICNAIAAIVVDGASVGDALSVCEGAGYRV